MSEKLKEALSAVIDGEADEFELRRVLDELPKDPALVASWERYHLIGATIRREIASGKEQMREHVWAAIEGEPTQAALVIEPGTDPGQAGRRRGVGRWLSLAVAASVALAVVVTVSNTLDSGGPALPEQADATDTADPAAQQAVINQLVLNSEISSKDEERLDAYTIWHTQTRGMNQAGFGAFTKMVTYQKD